MAEPRCSDDDNDDNNNNELIDSKQKSDTKLGNKRNRDRDPNTKQFDFH